MNELDKFSTTQISTAFNFRNMEEGSSSSSSSSIQLGSSPAIDRYNPIILDTRRLGGTGNSNTPPFLSPLPPPPSPSPSPLPNHQKQNTNTTDSFASKINNKLNKKKQKQKPIVNGTDDNSDIISSIIMNGRRSLSCMNMKADGFISPPGSSRYLLSEKAFLNVVSDFDPVLKLVPPETCKTHVIKKHESATSLHSSSVPAADQVVVLRVSLHCRGCERKIRKHLSRMEGVKSFNIDFVAKKVTVVGKVTPLEVLANILKVKNAQLWTPPLPHNNFELKKLES